MSCVVCIFFLILVVCRCAVSMLAWPCLCNIAHVSFERYMVVKSLCLLLINKRQLCNDDIVQLWHCSVSLGLSCKPLNHLISLWN